jgi:hypothetical protein
MQATETGRDLLECVRVGSAVRLSLPYFGHEDTSFVAIGFAASGRKSTLMCEQQEGSAGGICEAEPGQCRGWRHNLLVWFAPRSSRLDIPYSLRDTIS